MLGNRRKKVNQILPADDFVLKMCGICGVITNKAKSIDDLSNVVGHSCALMQHRGPDQSGKLEINSNDYNLCLGHQRLSIIDLSDDGKQPFVSKDGRFALTYNGEVYNYIELREELSSLGHVFETKTDTEVVLRAWIEWQEKCLQKFSGMFAFAIFDFKLSKGFLVRDAFGVKPLFYHCHEHCFVFASELAPLCALVDDKEKWDVNGQVAINYLLYGEYDNGKQTFLRDVYSLQPGQLIEINLCDLKQMDIRQWWEVYIDEKTSVDVTTAILSLRKIILNNIKTHLRSDVNLGISLSGGIDSSAIAYAVRELYPDLPISTFSFISSNLKQSEEFWVDKVNKDIGATSHKLTLSTEEFLNDVDDFIIKQGEPVGGTSVYAQYKLNEVMQRKGFKVVLEGQGADEAFGGYYGYPGQRMRSFIDQGKFIQALHFLKQWSNWPGRSLLQGVKYYFAEIIPDKIYKITRQYFGAGLNDKWLKREYIALQGLSLERRRQSQQQPAIAFQRRLKYQLSYQIMKRGLPSLLRHADRNSMAHSIESRVPFLTVTLVEFMMGLPERFFVASNGETKTLFRKAINSFVPPDIAFRKDKIGYETPEQKWGYSLIPKLRLKLQETEADYLFFSSEKILEILREHDKTKNKVSPDFVWRIYNFIVWYDWLLSINKK